MTLKRSHPPLRWLISTFCGCLWSICKLLPFLLEPVMIKKSVFAFLQLCYWFCCILSPPAPENRFCSRDNTGTANWWSQAVPNSIPLREPRPDMYSKAHTDPNPAVFEFHFAAVTVTLSRQEIYVFSSGQPGHQEWGCHGNGPLHGCQNCLIIQDHHHRASAGNQLEPLNRLNSVIKKLYEEANLGNPDKVPVNVLNCEAVKLPGRLS